MSTSTSKKKHPIGRPPMYKTPKLMQPKIEAYFADCDATNRPYTIPGLAYFLGFASRNALWEYAQKKEFADTISRARLRIEVQKNEGLVDPNRKNTRGVEFDLTNNFGWTNKQEVEHSGKGGGAIVVQVVSENAKNLTDQVLKGEGT